MKRAFLATAMLVLAGAITAPAVLAQPYPARPITLVVGSPPGSATDTVSRRFAEFMRTRYKATVLIDNKPGADGNIAALAVLRAPADGYSVHMTGNSVHGANANLYKDLGFDPINDMDLIGGVMASPQLLVVGPNFPARNVAEFIAEARKRDKPMFFGTSGASTRGVSELFKQRTGLRLDNVTYKGSPQVITDLIAGQFDFAFIDINTVKPFVQDGKLKALAISSARPHPALPNIPPIGETLKDFEFRAWVGVAMRAKSPPEAVAGLSRMLQEFVADPASVTFIESLGSAPMPLNPRQFKAFVEAETKMWADIVRIADLERK